MSVGEIVVAALASRRRLGFDPEDKRPNAPITDSAQWHDLECAADN
jgi:hypothetical protein